MIQQGWQALLPLELLMIRYLLTLTGHDLSVYSIYVKLCYKIYRETNIRVNETLSIVIDKFVDHRTNLSTYSRTLRKRIRFKRCITRSLLEISAEINNSWILHVDFTLAREINSEFLNVKSNEKRN